MCKVSDKIRFCSCGTASLEELDSYWQLYRVGKEEPRMVIGEPVMPRWVDEQTDLWNRTTLLTRINEPDAFDVDLIPQEGDRLHIYLASSDPFSSGFDYGLEWRAGKWMERKFDGLGWLWRHEEEGFGKLD